MRSAVFSYPSNSLTEAGLPGRFVGRHYAEIISELHATAMQLSTRPETLPAYNLRLYPITVERSALLAQLIHQEKHALEVVQTAYDEERERVEEEWRKGRDRIRERLLEGIEERRRRAREEKDSDGPVAGAYSSIHPARCSILTWALIQKRGWTRNRARTTRASCATNSAAAPRRRPRRSPPRRPAQAASVRSPRGPSPLGRFSTRTRSRWTSSPRRSRSRSRRRT